MTTNKKVSELRSEEKCQYLPLCGLVIVQPSTAQQQLVQCQTHFPAMDFKTVYFIIIIKKGNELRVL